jgi:acyl-CoA thioester hydrolase
MTLQPAPISEYRLRRRVHFYETDAAGIVHFSNFFRFVEEAERAMWREVGLNFHDPGAGMGWPRVSASFDYARPLRFDDEIEVVVRIVEITSKRMRYSCAIVRGDVTAATGNLTIACVRKQADGEIRSIEIPADIAARFAVAATANA